MFPPHPVQGPCIFRNSQNTTKDLFPLENFLNRASVERAGMEKGLLDVITTIDNSFI